MYVFYADINADVHIDIVCQLAIVVFRKFLILYLVTDFNYYNY